MGSRVVACGALFGMRFVRFYLFIIFFLEFVYELSYVGLYLGWDLSDFIYLLFFSEFVCETVAFSIFFLIIIVLLNWGLMKLRPFKLLIFLWLEALNFDDNFFLALLKKKFGP
jgi:hypothetical protein